MQCSKNPYNYANEQNTVYDANTNTMLYGINSRMKVTGVSDGTCNQINPLIYQDNYKCGLGSAGGNPCNLNKPNKPSYNLYNTRNKTIESFNNTGSNAGGNKITIFVTSILLTLIVILFIYTYYNHKKSI